MDLLLLNILLFIRGFAIGYCSCGLLVYILVPACRYIYRKKL